MNYAMGPPQSHHIEPVEEVVIRRPLQGAAKLETYPQYESN